jgi:carboxyl-terminal processing protease
LYLKNSNFSFKTKTEKSLAKAIEVAKTEKLDDDIQRDYDALISNLNQTKLNALDENKLQLKSLLTDEIVKRYAYREGLYDYYKVYNEEIKRAVEILANPSKYNNFLK